MMGKAGEVTPKSHITRHQQLLRLPYSNPGKRAPPIAVERRVLR